MNIRDRHGLKSAAADALSCAPNHQKLVLIWAAVNAALPLLSSVLNFILNSQIAETGGLSGIGLRSVLSTVQSFLSTGTSLVIPFWTLGYTAAVLRFSRKESADFTTLLEGFRRLGPALRLMLLEGFLFAMVCIACFYAGITVLSMTALADPVWAVLEQGETILVSGVIDENMLSAVTSAMMPMFWICCGLSLLVVTPILYHLRLADYCLLDASHRSAILAMRESRRLMHRNRLQLLKLDLSFWWFYLAQLVLTAVCYGDTILPILGIDLPFSEDAAYFIFYIVSLVAQGALLYFCSNRIQTTYALFYGALREPPKEENVLMP